MKRALDFTEGSEELPPAKVLCQRDRDSMASSSSTSQWKYDVFLNFRGEDTRNNLVDFLNYALQRKGFSIFKDDEKLEGGKTIKRELLKAIEESRFAVVILSENYASSTWCLDELEKIIDCKKEMGMTILPIFYNVDPSDVRKLKGAFAKAFVEHEKQFKEKVNRWRDALNHVAGIAGHPHVKNSPLSGAVEWIVGQLSHISSFEFSEITEGLVGIHSRLVELESCLALKDDVRFIGFWAMGGMGKSTLASVVYRRDSEKFEASCFIENVREKDELSLQKELISQISPKTNLIKNKYNGAHMIKKILWNKKVLLVLDDVDELKKLEMLVSKSDRFGSGSRIIITTRDRHLLKEFPVDVTFEVKALNYEDSLRLFCSKAFKKKQCPCEYLELSKWFLEYVNGLPLALEVLGSFLFEKSTAEWQSALDMLKENPEPEINKVLKISFFGLPDPVKDIFIDIACLFNHEDEDHVVLMLDSIGRYTKIGLTNLIEKSLLKISKNGDLWMHDLLRDMGRDIVRQKYRDEPGKQSRLWFYKDIDHVLKNNKGTRKVQVMDIRGAEACRRGFTFSLWNPNAFSKMSNLKFLRVSNVFPQHVPEHLPNSLRYLEWSGYPAKSLPCFQPNELVQLHLQHSKIEFLWKGMMIFENLKSINMDGSSNLIVAPDFDGVPNLKELVLSRCPSLCELHPSIGKLKKLELLDLEECQELTSLPDKFEMESLVTLNLTHCLKVKKIPEFVGNMELLRELLLKGTAIIELPSSIECLTGLNTLNLQNCKILVCLPNNICSLTSLNDLNLSGCSKFDKLPEDLGNIISLKNLNLSGTAIKELPLSIEFLIGLESLHPSIGKLKKLELLDLEECQELTSLPDKFEMESLVTLNLTHCLKVKKIPEFVGNMELLRDLLLEGTAIIELPSSIECLTGLNTLNLQKCKNLVCLPNNICSLTSLNNLFLFGCSKFDKLPEDLGNIISLKNLNLSGTAIKELPSSIEFLIGLESLNLANCKEFELLPSTVCSLKSLKSMYLSRCPKFVNLPENLGNLKNLCWLSLEGTAIEVLPSSVGRLAALYCLGLEDCKNLVCLPSTIGNLKWVRYLHLTGCSKITNLPESLGNMERLDDLYLGGTAIKELPSSTINLKEVYSVSFKGCQLSSSSLTYVPRSPVRSIDLSDCNLLAIPSGILSMNIYSLYLCGNNFVSLPESISQFSELRQLYLNGCKSLRSLSNIPSKVFDICVDNCTSLERLPEPPNDFYWSSDHNFEVQCFNCFKLACNIQNFSNMFQVQSNQQFEICYIIPGREIPKWFEKVNIYDTSVDPTDYEVVRKKVKIQLPGSGSGCDEWRGIVLCVLFLPTDTHHRFLQCHSIGVNGLLRDYSRCFTSFNFWSEYGKVESQHLWLQSVSKNNFCLPKTPGRSIDKKGFHQVELEIETVCLEVEKIGFRVV